MHIYGRSLRNDRFPDRPEVSDGWRGRGQPRSGMGEDAVEAQGGMRGGMRAETQGGQAGLQPGEGKARGGAGRDTGRAGGAAAPGRA